MKELTTGTCARRRSASCCKVRVLCGCGVGQQYVETFGNWLIRSRKKLHGDTYEVSLPRELTGIELEEIDGLRGDQGYLHMAVAKHFRVGTPPPYR